MRILVASQNKKKLAELEALLAPLGVELLTPADLGQLGLPELPEVVEDRDSFRGNAEKKALSGAQASGLWCLADDSGLEVDALDGAPGVYSARFAAQPGEDRASDQANNALLLERLADTPNEKRTAAFVCCLVLAAPASRTDAANQATPSVQTAIEERCPGMILREPRGSAGFGYDPLFACTDSTVATAPTINRLENEAELMRQLPGQTFAEMGAQAKALVGHRGRAMQSLLAQLPALLQKSTP